MEEECAVRNLVLTVCDLKSQGEVPNGRVGAQIATIGTKVYLYGGADSRRCYNDIRLLQIEKMLWRELTVSGFSKPSPRYGHSLCINGDELVLFGGLAADEILNDSAIPGIPNPLTYPPPLFMSNSCMATESTNNIPQWHHRGVPNNDLFIFETSSYTWHQPETSGVTPPPLGFHSAVVYKGNDYNSSLVVFGGTTSADCCKTSNDMFVLNLKSMEWSSPSQLGQTPSPRFGHKMCEAAHNDTRIYLFGGAYDDGAIFAANLNELNSKKQITWERIEVQSTCPLSRSFHSLDRIGDRICVLAGMTTSDISDFYIYEIKKNRWSRPLYEGQLNIRAHATAVLHDKLIVFGGTKERLCSSDTITTVESAVSNSASNVVVPPSQQYSISRRLFFLSVLAIKEGASSGDLKFKLVTVGDSGVGKSCLLKRFVQDVYSEFHTSTIGVDFQSVVAMVKGRLVTLQLWDTAGQERFSGVTGNYYRNSDGFVMVYDSTRRDSFEHLDRWLQQIKGYHECGTDTLKLLIGNKADIREGIQVSEKEGKAKAASIGALFVATSAKTAANVDAAFLLAATTLAEMKLRNSESAKVASSISGPTTQNRKAATGRDTGRVTLGAISDTPSDGGVFSGWCGGCGGNTRFASYSSGSRGYRVQTYKDELNPEEEPFS